MWRWSVVLAVIACAPPVKQAEIEQVLRSYESAYNQHDGRALAEVHTRDGRYAVPDGPVVQGRDALASFWSKSAGRGLSLQLVAYETSGDVGWALGGWSTRGAANGPAPHGRFLLALRREEGRWKIAVDINNDAQK